MLDDAQLVKHFPTLLKALAACIKALPTSLPVTRSDSPLVRYLGDLVIDAEEGVRYTANHEEKLKRIARGKYGHF
ncbi:hypothetical protein B0H13DRAFT_2386854 [Mycena leptocephala]|nr:hypothetical protein B0H13DRAFT_2386854 [Mycena leptocephala]